MRGNKDNKAVRWISYATGKVISDMTIFSPLTVTELREKYGLKTKVERYVSDQGGIPDKDKEFIAAVSAEGT